MPMGDTTMDVSVNEDNTGAFLLAISFPTQSTPCSKYYSTNTIWFREEIVKRGIKLLKIDTIQQLGYLFKKFMPRNKFEYLRKNIMGW